MRLLINGVEAGSPSMFKSAGGTYKCLFLEDDGTPVDLSSGTTTVEIYDTESRVNTVILSASVTPDGTVPDGGHGSITITDAQAGSFTTDRTYFGFGKRVVSTDASFAERPTYFKCK